MRKVMTGAAFIGAAILFVAVAGTAEAHFTKGRLHEHVPHMGCLVLKYEHRNKPEVKAIRATLQASGYRLYFDGHCWLRPGHKYRANPCV